MQLVAWPAPAYFPAAQAVQMAVASEYWPAAQFSQAAPALAPPTAVTYLPAAQSVQSVDLPTVDHLPAPQAVHSAFAVPVAAVPENLPASQFVHA